MSRMSVRPPPAALSTARSTSGEAAVKSVPRMPPRLCPVYPMPSPESPPASVERLAGPLARTTWHQLREIHHLLAEAIAGGEEVGGLDDVPAADGRGDPGGIARVGGEASRARAGARAAGARLAQASASVATPGTRPPEPRQSLRAPCWLVSMASVARPAAAKALAMKSALLRLPVSPWPKRTTGQPPAGAVPVGTVRRKGTVWISGAAGFERPVRPGQQVARSAASR